MVSLKRILRDIRKVLSEKEKTRETAQKEMRKTARLSKQAILYIHQKRLAEAKKFIDEAKEIISKLYDVAAEYPDLIYSGLFKSAVQEYAEANIFLKLVEETRFLSPVEINLSPVDYVLGLADVIGEYRRRTLDALREGNVKNAEKCLEIMEEIYVELMAMDEAYMLVPGLRRKCDVARKIIEVTRGDVTQEVRRSALKKYLRRFEKIANRT